MHVVFLTSAFPRHAGGGVDAVHVRRARELGRHADVVAVVPTPWAPRPLAALGGRWAAYGTTPRAATLDGVPVLYPRYLQVPRAGALAGLAMAAGAARAVRALRRGGRCDVLFAQALLPEGLAAILLGRRLGVPAACLGRGTDVHGLRAASPLARWLAGWTVARAAGVGVVAHDLAARVEDLAVRRVPTLLPNGVDLERFAPGDRAAARRALDLPAGDPVVLFVGRLGAGKGVDVLLEAFVSLLEHLPAAHLVLAGGGPLLPGLRARAQRPPLAGRLRLPGEVGHDAVASWLCAADVLALPSRAEGAPNVVREALACGRPVVATPVGDVPRLVGADVGRLVPVGDAAALAGALEAVLRTSWRPREIRARVADMTWERNAEATFRFLQRALVAP